MNEWIVAELYSISLFRCTRSSSSTHQLTENQSATTLIVDHLSNKVIMPEMDSLLIRIQLTISLVNNHHVCVSYPYVVDIAQTQVGVCQVVLQSVATGDVG